MYSESLTPSTPTSTGKNSTQKSLLIFDLDGTLIDSVPDLADAVNATLKQLDRATFDEDTIRHWVGNGAKVLIERALSGQAEVKADLSPELVEKALPLFFANYRKQTCLKTKAYDDVTENLKKLKSAGYTLAIITNKPAEFVPTIAQNLGWQGLFDMILGGDSLPTKKPDPAPLLHVCEKLGVDVANSYMIGDSKNDVLAGKNAGMDTLALSYGYNYGQDIREMQPNYTFDNFADLTEFLLNARV